MKFGVSTYSLNQAMQAGKMTVLEVIDYIAEIGGEHVEIVPIGFDLTKEASLTDKIRERAAQRGLEISNYAIGAEFGGKSGAAWDSEVSRVQGQVDIAAALGVKLMRHDVASSDDRSIAHYMSELPRLAEACRLVADYAAPLGITTSVENHGYFLQASDRVQALVQAVNRANFRTTMDIGNFMCADENPAAAVANNISYASMIHIKDFYLRPAAHRKGEGWFRTNYGNYLRGAIVGDGDIAMQEVLGVIKRSGYDGYLSLEFEGMEECTQAVRIGLDNLRRMWEEIEE